MGDTTVLDDGIDTSGKALPARQPRSLSALGLLDRYLSALFQPAPSSTLWNGASYAALIVLVAVWAALFYTSWATWGNLTIDSGHEMYVPAALSAGKMLYRDIWFMYGPAAPYINSYVFRLFGLHLSVLYWAGSLAALGSAIFLYLTGLRLGSWLAGWTAGAVVLIQAFSPGLFCFPLPYSFSSVYGCLCACAFLWLVMQASRSDRWWWMLAAATIAALALLLKLEFGVACYATLLLLIAVVALRRRSWKPLWSGATAMLPGLLACALVVRWMVSIAGPAFITQENFMSWPTSYFMQVYGKLWLANTGFHLSGPAFIAAFYNIFFLAAVLTGLHFLLRRNTPEGNWAFLFSGLSLALLGSISFVPLMPVALFLAEHALLADLLSIPLLLGMVISIHFLLRHKPARLGLLFLALALGVAALVFLVPMSVLQGALRFRRIFFPQEMVLILALASALCWWHIYRDRAFRGGLTLAAVFTFPVLLSFRILMGMQTQGYSIFYNGTALLAFLFLASRVIASAPGSSPSRFWRAQLLVCAGCLVWVVTQDRVFVDRYKNLAPLVTERGVIWAPKGMVPKYQQAIAFMKEKAAAGQSVLSVPEDTSLYFLSGTICPTRVYQFTPGVLVPGKMTEGVIQEIEQKKVAYLLWSNRTSNEYGVPLFGKDYDSFFAGYLTSHYRRIGPLGKYYDEGEWSVMVWQRIEQ